MATWREVFARGRQASRTLKQRGTPTTEYSSTSGSSKVKGWELHRLYGMALDTQHFGSNTADYKETWGDKFLVLGVDGVIYEYTVSKEEFGPGMSGTGKVRTEVTTYLHRMDPRITQSRSYGKTIQINEVLDALKLLSGR